MTPAKMIVRDRQKEVNENLLPVWSLDMLQTAASQTMNETECLLSMDCLDGCDGWEVSTDGVFFHGKLY